MRRLPLLITLAALACGGSPEVTLEGDAVLLATDDLDVRLSRVAPFDGSFMLFGGTYANQTNVIGSVLLSGLPAGKAGAIARQYPDFYRCSSKGAPLAQRSVVQLQIVPADGDALAALRSALGDFEHNLRRGGDRVCVDLQGSRLELDSIVVREAGEAITKQYPIRTFYLVESARSVDCREAMSAG